MEAHNLQSRPSDRVFIRDLTLNMSAGIYAHEKAAPQRVIVNITLDVERNLERILHSIDDVVSYELVVNAVTEIANTKHYDLLEEFAEEISNMCLKNNLVHSVKITLEKPDIIESTKSVGIEIIRGR